MPRTTKSRRIDRRFVKRALREMATVERVGAHAATVTGTRLRARFIHAFRYGQPFNLRGLLYEIQPTLARGMLIAYLYGKRRAWLSVPKGLSLAIPRGYDKALEFLQRRLEIPVSELDTLADKFDASALRVLDGTSARVEQRLQEAVLQTVQEGLHVKGGVKVLRQTFDDLGLTPKNSYTLENIFRTQTQLAYSAGRATVESTPEYRELLWGYRYSTVGDDRVRETHAEMEGATALADDLVWERWRPPNGWGCRCQLIPLFDEAEVYVPTGVEPDEGFGFNPAMLLGLGSSVELAFDPNQPREPAGSEIGGRWTDMGGAVRQHLGMIKKMTNAQKPSDFAHGSLESLVLKEGRSFELGPLPEGVRYGKEKECFKTAFNLAESNPDRYVYVEGFATTKVVPSLPIWHAWVANKTTGKVIDNTWKDGVEYFGIPMKWDFVRKAVHESETYGVFSDFSKTRISSLKHGMRPEDMETLSSS